MTGMLDDVTSLLIIIKTKGRVNPASTNLPTMHHRMLIKVKGKARPSIKKKAKRLQLLKVNFSMKRGN
tara:strand:+ start:187 stop:390 length:204 start_codon:yes stop_codon:yes gene_type:complete